MASDIQVLSWNINGLKAKFKKSKTVERKTKLLEIFEPYHVVLLQETHIGKMKDGKGKMKDGKGKMKDGKGKMKDGKADDNDWKFITEAFEKYALVKLEDLTCRETADNQEETTEEEEKEGEEGEEGEEGGSQRRRRELRTETMYMTYFSSSSKGVGILVNKPHTLLKAFSKGGDYAWVHVEIDRQKYTFVSVYYHRVYPHLICNLMLEIFYSFLTKGLDAFTCRLVIGGDFNTTLDPKLDATTGNSKHTARRKKLNEFLRIMKLSDVWREMHHEDRKYTHTYTYKNKDKEVKTTKSRLDYVFVSKDDVKYVKSCEILDDIDLSDHSPVSLTLNYTNDQWRKKWVCAICGA
ncbi:hypothetical protein R3I94_007046 [Phoxinus phoxinus]